MLGSQREVAGRQRLEDREAGPYGQRRQVVLADHGAEHRAFLRVETADVDRGEPELAFAQGDLTVGLQRDERAGVAAVVHRVVDEPRVAADRHPPPGGAEVRLGGHRVLVVGELVGGVGEEFGQRHPEVGGMPLGPVRHGQAQPVQHGAPQTVEVPRGVVDDRRRRVLLLRRFTAPAVVRGGAGLREGELRAVVARVEPRIRAGARPAVRVGLHHAQPVARGVPRPVDPHVHQVVQLRVVRGLHSDLDGPDAGDPPPALDTDVARADAVRGPAEEGHRERAAVVAGLHAVDAVEPGGTHVAAPPVRAAFGAHAVALPS